MTRVKQTPLELNEKIKEELGIDMTEYRNEEVAEKLVEMLVFPIYAASWIIRPMLVGVVMYIAGFFILDLYHIQYLLYGIVGLILILATGLVFGILYFLNRMHQDIESIMGYTVDVGNRSMLDVKKVQNLGGRGMESKDSKKLLLIGVVKIVTVPVIAKVLGNKIPLMGGLLAGSIERILLMMTNKLDFDQVATELEEELNEEVAETEIGQDSVGFQINGDRFGNILDTVMNVVRVPFRVVFFILMMITLIFIYIIN